MNTKRTAFLLFVLLSSIAAKSQTADEVVAKYIAFTGGEQQWKKIKTITSTGTYNYGGMEFPFTSYSKAPNRYKYVVTFKGKSFMQAFDGKEGWRIDGFKNETKKTRLTGKQASALANESDVELESPFINYDKKGYQISPEGTDTVNNQLCYKIRLIRTDGDTATYFFDRNNFALVKKVAIAKNTELQNSVLDIYYSDYQKTGGLNLPRLTRCTSKGQDILIIVVKNAKFNLPIADSIFKY